MISRPAFALALAAAALLGATQAQAHAKLVSASPAENAAGPAPRAITLRFNEKLQPKLSGFELSAGGAATPVKIAVSKDRMSMVGTPAKPLAAGAYEVRWHAVTSDMHRMEGHYGFTVR